MRRSGILLHITSLPSGEGIGTMGQEAFRFVDMLKEAGFTVWQVLPIGPTGYGESPYQSGSTYAGNPLMIDLTLLRNQGLLAESDLVSLPESDRIDFEQVKQLKNRALRASFRYGWKKVSTQVHDFLDRTTWLKDYSLYAALKEHFELRSWMTWPEDIRHRRPEAMEAWKKTLRDEIDYQCYLQYLFDMQWRALKEYANNAGVSLMGDIPIYVAEDSADTWAHPENFQFDADLHPTRVAGVPPDYFCEDGQLWGNPLYNWRYLHFHRFAWWMDRLENASQKYDILRIDHFIGFANYYSIPYGSKNARVGKWVNAPGKALFRRVKKELPDLEIVAEDLGVVSARVKKLLESCGFPGMRVLQFAFGGDDSNQHLPANCSENIAYYTGTHDNDTSRGYWERIPKQEKENARKVLGSVSDEEAVAAMIRTVFSAAPALAVVPMQDLLDLDNKARMNYPGTLGGNWLWRMTHEDMNYICGKAPLLRKLLKGCDRI